MMLSLNRNVSCCTSANAAGKLTRWIDGSFASVEQDLALFGS